MRALDANGILRATFETMLANHDGALLTFFEIFGEDENAVSKDAVENIQDDLVASPMFCFVDSS